MIESTTTASDDILRTIEEIRRSSRRSIPVAILGVGTTLIALVLVAWYIWSLQSQLTDARQRLESSNVIIKNSQAERADLEQTLRALRAQPNQTQQNVAVLDNALKQSTEIGAELGKAVASVEAATRDIDAATKSTTADDEFQSYDFDIFYCEAGGAAAARAAQRVVEAKPATATGRWRARPLSIAQNARPGYRIDSAQIRYEASEQSQALALATMIKTTVGTPMRMFELGQYKSRFYVSAFFCGNLAKAE